jgi:hypothetical protein
MLLVIVIVEDPSSEVILLGIAFIIFAALLGVWGSRQYRRSKERAGPLPAPLDTHGSDED